MAGKASVINLHYIARGQQEKPIGPLTKSQISEALHRGLIAPEDRVWVCGPNAWFFAKDRFADFFASESAALLERKRKEQRGVLEKSVKPALLLDFVLALVATAVCGVVLSVADGPLWTALPFGPLLYWSLVVVVADSRSPGMRRYGVEFRSLRQKASASPVESMTRGVLSYCLILLAGFEFRNQDGWPVFRSCAWLKLEATAVKRLEVLQASRGSARAPSREAVSRELTKTRVDIAGDNSGKRRVARPGGLEDSSPRRDVV